MTVKVEGDVFEVRWKVYYVENEAAETVGWFGRIGIFLTYMTENSNHCVPTWTTPATVSRQSRALCHVHSQ